MMAKLHSTQFLSTICASKPIETHPFALYAQRAQRTRCWKRNELQWQCYGTHNHNEVIAKQFIVHLRDGISRHCHIPHYVHTVRIHHIRVY